VELASEVVIVVTSEPVIQGVVQLAARSMFEIRSVGPEDDLGVAIDNAFAPIVVVDVDPYTAAALEPARRARAFDSSCRLVLLADVEEGDVLLEALRLAPHAIVRKPQELADLGDTLARVAIGERTVDAELERAAISGLGRFARQAREGSAVDAALTPREQQILVLLAEGLTTRQIGRRLGISARTVEAHVAKLYRKLSVHSRVQAISRAASLGLLELG